MVSVPPTGSVSSATSTVLPAVLLVTPDAPPPVDVYVRLIHGSEPNRAADRRIGFAIRYIPTTVRQTVGPKDSATLVRGVDEYRNFDHETAPASDLSAAALAQHTEITERQAKILYAGTPIRNFDKTTAG